MPTPSEVLDIEYLGSDLTMTNILPYFTDSKTVMLPLVDTQTKKTIYPDYIKHHKFCIPIWKAEIVDTYPDTMLYTIIQDYLKEIGEPADRFIGSKYVAKKGLFAYNNPYRTAIRLWTSYKNQDKIVYEATIVGYPVSD